MEYGRLISNACMKRPINNKINNIFFDKKSIIDKIKKIF